MVAAQSPGLGLCTLGRTIFDDASEPGQVLAKKKADGSAF
jgi:hypothetical protein